MAATTPTPGPRAVPIAKLPSARRYTSEARENMNCKSCRKRKVGGIHAGEWEWGGWASGGLGEWASGRAKGRMDGRMNGWLDSWMDGRVLMLEAVVAGTDQVLANTAVM